MISAFDRTCEVRQGRFLRLIAGAVGLVALAGLAMGSLASAQAPAWQQLPDSREFKAASRLNWTPGRPATNAGTTGNRISQASASLPWESSTPVPRPMPTTPAAKPVRNAIAPQGSSVFDDEPEKVDPEVIGTPPAAMAPVPDATDFAVEPLVAGRAAAGVGPGWDGGCGGDACGAGGCDEGTVCMADAILSFPCTPLYRWVHNRLWIRTETLFWWGAGAETPALLNTSPLGTPQTEAGINGPLLVGDRGFNREMEAGGRLNFGMWFGPNDDVGWEFTYLGIGGTDRTNNTSDGTQILARPFFNVRTGQPDAHLIAFPGLIGGDFSVRSISEFNVGEVIMRRALSRKSNYHADFLIGYRFQRLDEELFMSEHLTTQRVINATPAGTIIDLTDRFDTRNDFNGGELGVATEWHRARWSLETLWKLGLGGTHSRVYIDGQTTNTPPGGGTPGRLNGGLLALPTNMGQHDTHQFSVAPEFNMTLGYFLAPRLRATFGYTFLYWSNVLRPGDQIDTGVDPAQLPPPQPGTVSHRPAFQPQVSDYWAQGMNFGLDYRF